MKVILLVLIILVQCTQLVAENSNVCRRKRIDYCMNVGYDGECCRYGCCDPYCCDKGEKLIRKKETNSTSVTTKTGVSMGVVGALVVIWPSLFIML